MSTTAVSFSDLPRDVLLPEAPNLPPAVAEWALTVRLSEAQRERMLELADLRDTGEMTGAQAEEADNYRRLGNFLRVLHAKARLSLREASQAN